MYFYHEMHAEGMQHSSEKNTIRSFLVPNWRSVNQGRIVLESLLHVDRSLFVPSFYVEKCDRLQCNIRSQKNVASLYSIHFQYMAYILLHRIHGIARHLQTGR